MDPLVLTLATAMAAKSAEALVAGGTSALGSLLRLLRERLGPGTSREHELEAALRAPTDHDRRDRLASLLDGLVAEDPAFADQMRAYCRRMMDDSARSAVDNRFSGSAAAVIQARDIQGNISF